MKTKQKFGVVEKTRNLVVSLAADSKPTASTIKIKAIYSTTKIKFYST